MHIQVKACVVFQPVEFRSSRNFCSKQHLAKTTQPISMIFFFLIKAYKILNKSVMTDF